MQRIHTPHGRELIVRLMMAEDLCQIQRIEQQVHSHPWSSKHFSNCLDNGNLALVVEAPAAGEVLAYAVASLGGGEADLLNLAVASNSQRQGIARCLLKHLLSQVAGRADTLFLEVRESNQGAITLYEALGFNQVGVRPRYYPAASGREDALIMARMLD